MVAPFERKLEPTPKVGVMVGMMVLVAVGVKVVSGVEVNGGVTVALGVGTANHCTESGFEKVATKPSPSAINTTMMATRSGTAGTLNFARCLPSSTLGASIFLPLIKLSIAFANSSML